MKQMLTSSALVCIDFPHEETQLILLHLALDPNVKLAYATDKWDSEAMQDGIVHLKAVVVLPRSG